MWTWPIAIVGWLQIKARQFAENCMVKNLMIEVSQNLEMSGVEKKSEVRSGKCVRFSRSRVTEGSQHKKNRLNQKLGFLAAQGHNYGVSLEQNRTIWVKTTTSREFLDVCGQNYKSIFNYRLS